LTGRCSLGRTGRAAATCVAFGLFSVFNAGCELRQAMYDQEKYEAHEASNFFADGLSARQPVKGTVARGDLRLDQHLYTGKTGDELAATLPASVRLDIGLLKRGQQRFEIFCAPCHDRTGGGNGMIVQRGFKQPPSMHLDRLRNVPVGHFYDVITNGFGNMASYASRIPVKDRWAIAAYIRALQFSQNAAYDALSAEDKNKLQ